MFFSSLNSFFIVSLRIDKGDDDGEIRWDGDEHCSDRLRCNFEFHSIMGVMPL